MHYYKTREDCEALALEFRDEFTSREALLDIIGFKHGLTELGNFSRMVRFGFITSVQELQGDWELHEFKAAPGVMDFLVNDGPFEDVILRHSTVMIFGKMVDGQISEIAALNFSGLINPEELPRP